MHLASDAPVILVTGTRTGLGRHLAAEWLQRGLRVVGCSRGPCDLADAGYRHFQADVRSESDVQKMFVAIRREIGRLDGLVNNAGVMAVTLAMLTAGSVAEQILATNFRGTFLCCREAAALMKKRGFGRIVNLSSISVVHAFPGNAIYGASKAAVEQFTRVMAKEVIAYGITVNALGLPPIENTGMVAALPDTTVADALAHTALGRLVTPSEVARAIDFFLAEESDAITGQVLYLGGP